MTKAPKKFDDKPGETFIRPDPDNKKPDNTVPSTGTIPEHQVGAIEGVIQDKDNRNAPIVERAPNEQDLNEGKITPQAVEKPAYDAGVTQEDIDLGKVSPTAVRETARGVERDEDLNDMITVLRNRTQMARLNRVEVAEVIQTLKAEGYEITRTKGPSMSKTEAVRA